MKNVPIREIFSLSTPNKKIGVAKIHPQMYKKGINIMVDNNFGLKKNKPKYMFFILSYNIFISIFAKFLLF